MDAALETVPAEQRRQREQAVVRALRGLRSAQQAHSRWVERQCGVSAAQLWALWELQRAPGLRVSALSAALSIHRSTASNMLDKLENKQLVRRARADGDHREVRLYLTELGTALLAAAPRPAQGYISHALDRLSDEQLATLAEGLAGLTAAIGAGADAGARPFEQT